MRTTVHHHQMDLPQGCCRTCMCCRASSLPLNRAGRLAGDVIHHPVDAAHLCGSHAHGSKGQDGSVNKPSSNRHHLAQQQPAPTRQTGASTRHMHPPACYPPPACFPHARTWLQMRADTVRRNSGVKGYQSAVMPSLLHTARRPTTWLRACVCVCAEQSGARGQGREQQRQGVTELIVARWHGSH